MLLLMTPVVLHMPQTAHLGVVESALWGETKRDKNTKRSKWLAYLPGRSFCQLTASASSHSRTNQGTRQAGHCFASPPFISRLDDPLLSQAKTDIDH